MVGPELTGPLREIVRQAGEDVLPGPQFGSMPLAIGKRHRFNTRKPVERPGDAGCGILATREQHKRTINGGTQFRAAASVHHENRHIGMRD